MKASTEAWLRKREREAHRKPRKPSRAIELWHGRAGRSGPVAMPTRKGKKLIFTPTKSSRKRVQRLAASRPRKAWRRIPEGIRITGF